MNTAAAETARSTDALPVLDWAEFYKEVQSRADIPHPSLTVIDSNHAVFQAMYVDLADVKTALTASGLGPPLVTVIADVLNIPLGCSWSLNGTVLQILARRVQTEGDFRVALDFRTSATASLLFYCDELAGVVRATALRSGDPTHFEITQPNPLGGQRLALVDNVAQKLEISWSQGIPFELPEWFTQAMRTEFLYASVLYAKQPEIAIAQYRWLKNWTGYNTELQGLFLQSASLLALLSAQVKATANGTAFVPYLSQDVYGELAESYTAQATEYESDYRALQTQLTVDDQFIGLAKTLLANKTYESAYNDELLAQAKHNFDNATAAADAAERTLNDARLTAELIAVDFDERGVKEWQRGQIAKAVIDLGTAIIGFAVGIGTTFLGDPAGGAGAVTAAVNGAKAVEKAAEAGSEIVTLAKQLSEAMEKLKQTGEALHDVYELAEAVISVVGDLEHAQGTVAEMRDMSADLGGADLTATYQWQVYQQASDATLQSPVGLGIEFADQLKLAIDAVAVYGQALAAAQVASIEAGQHYATISLQSQLAKLQQTELQSYVDNLTTGEDVPAELLQRFYQLYLDAKGGLFAAIQGYRASYYYWALTPSGINPSILDGLDDLATGLSDLTGITLDHEAALEHFDPPPQLMVDSEIVISDPQVLAQLAEHGQTRWVVPADAEEFAGFERIRLTGVRVWIDGATVPDGHTVNVLIATQGNYLDRFDDKPFQFTAKPLVCAFKYRVSTREVGPPAWRFPDHTYGYVVVDGVVDNEVAYAYFQPTPFGQWQITVSGKGLDLSGVSRLVLQFAGSVIPDI